MDYVVGGVAALISGNVTPNRPKIVKKALTPIKHQPSPNVTPKSQVVDDRSVFLSPSVQKKKSIVKKSPKRIFQAPSLDETDDGECSKLLSPKADKAKKHLQNDLEGNEAVEAAVIQPTSTNSPKKKSKKKQKKEDVANTDTAPTEENLKSTGSEENASVEAPSTAKSKKKRKKKNKKNHLTVQDNKEEQSNEINNSQEIENKVSKKKKKISKLTTEEMNQAEEPETPVAKKSKKKNKSKNNEIETVVNPNAITDKDSDSEHESDNEINSDQSDDEEIEQPTEPADTVAADSEDEADKKESPKKEKTEHVVDETEVLRTIFVGNVPFSSKCKKQIKKIFSKHGEIETVRIRTVPVKDARLTPKLAVIKNELHPERDSVNVYVKFKDASSVAQALSENNTLLEAHHLRVSRADSSGAGHDPRRAVYVGNVPFGASDDALRERFESCGAIESVRIVRDRKTNAGKGFGYVNFASIDSVELALGLSDEDLTMKNRILRVARCNPGQGRQGAQPSRPRQQGPPQNRPGPHQNRSGPHQNRSGPPQNRSGPPHNNRQGPPQNGRGPPQNRQGPNSRQGPPQNGRGPPQKRQGASQKGQGQRQRNDFQGKPWQARAGEPDATQGAYRRIKKRKNEEAGEAPREKKQKKEFVGVTAEKKKKQKFQKGQKKKKALSEILTK